MRIGVTEQGDAGINLAWTQKIGRVDGAVLISKNFSEPFKAAVLEQCKPLILHCTCTGYGGTRLEPHVPAYQEQLDSMKNLIDRGFPASHVVLRVDPIFPTEKGLRRVRDMLDYFLALGSGVTRVRVSIVDEYPHVRERYRERGWAPLYGGKFSPSTQQVEMVASVLNAYPIRYETCAEQKLSTMLRNTVNQGCVSVEDLHLMDITVPEELRYNPQRRKDCCCLCGKVELLTERKPCPHGCVYCFWK